VPDIRIIAWFWDLVMSCSKKIPGDIHIIYIGIVPIKKVQCVVSVFSPVNVFIGSSEATTRSRKTINFNRSRSCSVNAGPGAYVLISCTILPAFFYYFFSFRYLLF